MMKLLHRITEWLRQVVNISIIAKVRRIKKDEKVKVKQYPVTRRLYKYRRMDKDTFDTCKNQRATEINK